MFSRTRQHLRCNLLFGLIRHFGLLRDAKPDSLISLYLIYFYFSEFSFLFFFDLLFSRTRQHLRCNLLFGLIRHFGLLKDINISFFLSLSLSLQSNHKFFTVILVWFCIILFSAINTCQFLVQFVMFANLLLPSTLLLTSI